MSESNRWFKRIGRFLLDSVLYLGLAALLWIFYLMQPVWKGDKATPALHSDPARLYRHVEMLSVQLPERIASQTNLDASAAYIHAELSRYCSDVSDQAFDVDGETFRNVIARFGSGEGPLYVIGAHYDTERGNPGADDNASGIAGLIELARLFSLSPPGVSVELVAYTLEEPPHFRTTNMGSFRHAQRLSEQEREVALMVALETIGYFRDETGSQAYPVPGMERLYPDRGDFIALVGRMSDPLAMRSFKSAFMRSTAMPAYSINAPAMIPGIDFSDHLNYWKFDMPAIMVTDTAFYRSPHYHEATDTIETLDFERMAQVVDGVFGAVKLLGPERE